MDVNVLITLLDSDHTLHGRARVWFAEHASEGWPSDISILTDELIDSSKIHGPRQLTDVYLLALAVQHRDRFVTFDAAVSVAAVRLAAPQHLWVL